MCATVRSIIPIPGAGVPTIPFLYPIGTSALLSYGFPISLVYFDILCDRLGHFSSLFSEFFPYKNYVAAPERGRGRDRESGWLFYYSRRTRQGCRKRTSYILMNHPIETGKIGWLRFSKWGWEWVANILRTQLCNCL